MNPKLLLTLGSLMVLPVWQGCSSSKSSTGETPGTGGGSPAGTGGKTTGTGGDSSSTGGARPGTGGTSPVTGTGSGGDPGSTGGRATAASGGLSGGGTVGTATGGAPAIPGTGGAGGAAAATSSVLERNNHPSRDGHFVQPTLTKARAAMMARDTTFSGTFSGAMWASPLYLENGPGGKGVFFAVTTGNMVYALDETTGDIVWMKSIGTPSTSGSTAGGQCNSGGLINPLGILSTPVIDPQTRTIYVAGVTGTAQGIGSHIATALSVDDGTVKPGWPVDVSTKIGFNAKIHNQRSALSLVNGILYIGYAGFVGDCDDYRGRIVAINTAMPTMVAGWASGAKGEGIWAAGGLASDGNGVIAVTGNNTAGSSTHFDSEQVMRVTGMATFTRSGQNVFFPSRWRNMDGTDADFGSSNPLLLTVTGATPSNYVAALSKDGHLYLLNSTNLGGADSNTPVVDFTVASGTMSVKTSPTAYAVGSTARIALTTDGGATCPGGVNGRVVMSVSIPAGSPPVPQRVWCVALGGNGSPPSPISTSTDGKTDSIVWVMNNGSLNGIDGDTGQMVFAGAGGACAGVRRWTSPIAVKGRIVVGGDGNLCSWSPH